MVWLLADTGATRTTLLDRDLRILGILFDALEPSPVALVGIGGSVRSCILRGVELTFGSEEGDLVLRQDLWTVQHDLAQMPPDEAIRVLRLPSILGRDVLNRFRFTADYQAGRVVLEGP